MTRLAPVVVGLMTTAAIGGDERAIVRDDAGRLVPGEEGTTLRLGGIVQARFTANRRDAAPATSEELTIGSSVQRAKLVMSGQIGDDTWSYKLVTAFGSAGGAAVLTDAWVAKRVDAFRFGAGQFKPPFLQEELVDITRQLAVERSVVNETFNQGRAQGVWGEYASSDWRVMAAITDGFSTANTENFAAEADAGLTVRGEWMVDGNRAVLGDFVGFPGGDVAAQLGFAAHHEFGGETAAGLAATTLDISRTGLTADVQVEGDGWSAFAAAVWVGRDPAGGIATDDYGIVLQGSWMPDDRHQVFGRVDVVLPDDAVNPALDAFPTVTVGATRFMTPESQALKVVVDLQVALEAFAPGSPVPAFGGGGGVFGAGSAAATGLVFDTGDPQAVFRVLLQGQF